MLYKKNSIDLNVKIIGDPLQNKSSYVFSGIGFIYVFLYLPVFVYLDSVGIILDRLFFTIIFAIIPLIISIVLSKIFNNQNILAKDNIIVSTEILDEEIKIVKKNERYNFNISKNDIKKISIEKTKDKFGFNKLIVKFVCENTKTLLIKTKSTSAIEIVEKFISTNAIGEIKNPTTGSS